MKKKKTYRRPKFHRNLPPSVQQCQTEITQWSPKFKKGSSSPLALMEGILVRSYFFYLSSVPYLDQEEINLRKKFPYSYSVRFVFHMPGSYHLTIFISYLGLRSRHLKSYPLSVKNLGEKKITSNSSMKFLSPEVALYLYKSTIRPCMEYCCHVWAGAPSCYLELLDKLQKRIRRTVGPSLCCFSWTLGSSSKPGKLKSFL